MGIWAEFKDTLRQKILLPDARTLPKRDEGLVAWMVFFLRPYRTLLTISSMLRLVRYTSYALVPYFFSLLIDTLQTGKAFENPQPIWHAMIVIGTFYLVVVSAYMLLVYENLALDKITRSLTLFSVRHLLALPLDWHEQQGSGAKLQRIMQARDNCKLLFELISYNVLPLMGDLLGVVITIIALHAPTNIFFLFFGYVASYILVSWMMVKPVDKLQNKFYSAKEDLVSRVYDLISLIRMTKSFALSTYVEDRSRQGEQIGHSIMRKIRLISFSKWSLINIIVWFWIGAIVFICFHYALEKKMTIAGFSAIIFMAYRLWGSLEDIARLQSYYLDYKSGFLRIRETLSALIQNYDFAPVVQTSKDWQQIECRDLAFYYHVEQPVLQNINLTIPRNKHIALIGHSGAGKSTMVKLLMKQVIPTDGQLLIGKTELKHIDSTDWLSHLALVPQDVELMNATLRENILLDQTDIDEEFYRECLCKSYLEDFVASLPQGDQTEIGERGVKLSGGQKQRLGIARALARNAQIIILDEATSSLDSESEAFIQRAMETAFTDKTVIVIAHRLSTIRHADMIYVFDKGVIAESGNFATLEKSKGIFSRLWAMQSDGFIAN